MQDLTRPVGIPDGEYVPEKGITIIIQATAKTQDNNDSLFQLFAKNSTFSTGWSNTNGGIMEYRTKAGADEDWPIYRVKGSE